jgi:hypothetical protein
MSSFEHELDTTSAAKTDLGRWPAYTGIASVGLLAASIRWAHHFGVVTDLLILSWATTFLFALVGSLLTRPRKRAARLALMCSLVSVAALVVAGVVFAAGGDPAGACGGG